MKAHNSLTTSLLLTQALAIPHLLTRDATCSVQSSITTTFYGYPDNDPPSAQTAFDCLGRDNIAGGTGTYDDPLTFATAPREYTQCEIIYSAYLHKYLICQDTCAECTTDFRSGKKHIDIWTGSSTVSGGQAQIQCEDDLTPDSSNVVRNPPQDLPVSADALFSGGKCNTGATFKNDQGSCDGAGTGTATGSSSTSSSSSAARTPTTTGSPKNTGDCAWEGHCAGAACSSDDDCSDVLTCNAGVCGIEKKARSVAFGSHPMTGVQRWRREVRG